MRSPLFARLWRGARAVICLVGENPLASAVIGCSGTTLAFYPGYMSYDSIIQFREARAFSFSDQHPPAMALIWHFLDRFVISGPAGMLMLQNLAYWAAIALLCWTLLPRSPFRRAALLGLGWMPQVAVYLGTIWKDVGMGVFILLGYSALVTYARRRRAGWLALGGLSLLYAACLRHNAILAVTPILLMAGVELAQGHKKLGLALGGALAVATAVFALSFPGWIQASRTDFWQVVPLYDLIGISAIEGQDLLPEYFEREDPAVDAAFLRRAYSIRAVDYSFHPFFPEIKNLEFTQNPDKLREIRSQWLAVVATHPWAYLKHRWGVYRSLMGITRYVYLPFWKGIDENEFGIRVDRTWLNRVVMSVLEVFRNSIFFRGFLFLVILCACLVPLARPVSAWRAPVGREDLLPLAFSAFLVFTSDFFIVPGADFRFVWWAVLATSVVAILMVPTRRPARKA